MTTAQAAIACGRILGRSDRRASLLDGIDHRYDDSPGARIQDAFDQVMIAFRNASQGHAASICNGAEDRCSLRPIDR